MQQLISSYGDIDYPSPMFAYILRAAPFLRSLLRLPDVLPGRWLGWFNSPR
jgi:hypothetical protein